ncbi:hypothetical protein F9K97_02285 [Brucella anthropi]|uniref:hypothetical protein n=1 Tax=Brucella anthropi TaxID=529 RepID=UPI00124CACD0|nr:hypothetical protein [Brucella anthropi]KAB2780507.1 hypothetical protein F9L00_07965 [Brucella anthropi]KAB2789389.1 hypothetical protein F9K97_02285 [Brucella anthropi]
MRVTSPAVKRLRRLLLEKWIEDAIALLDTMDGDADLEDDAEYEDERELDHADYGICDADAAAEYFPASAYWSVQ